MHDGHRKRLRERFRSEGLEGFADHEVLELLLFYGRARGDVNPAAHALLDTFGSLQAVLEATPDQLMAVPGVGEETATLIALLVPAFRRYSACLCRARRRFAARRDVKLYCRALLAGWRTERLYVIGLDADHQLLGSRLVAEGSTGSVQVQPRMVAEAALNMNARAIILCHNHPGGADWPSQQDLSITQHIQLVMRSLDVELLDHLIIAGERTYSMEENGDLDTSQALPEVEQRAADSGGQPPPHPRACRKEE